MKKILAVLFVVCLVFTMAVPAMAENYYPSPSGDEEYKVEVRTSDPGKGSAQKIILPSGDIQAIATIKDGEQFYGWTITGASYTIVSGSLSSPEIVIRATGDVEVIAHFSPFETKPGDNNKKSPQSNDNMYLGLYAAFAVILVAGAAVVVTKKYALSK